MHKQLKFSWAHILALLAALFFGYMAFVGNAYRSGGNIDMSVLCAVVMALVAIGAAVIPQMFKASDWNMKLTIKVERFFILFFTPALCIIMLGITGGFNYINIVSNEADIEGKFAKAKRSASDMFTEYDEYSRARVEALFVSNSSYAGPGRDTIPATELPSAIQKENMKLLLKDKITFDNRELANFRNEVEEYLGGRDTSIYNVSVLSDIQALQSSMQEWYAFLSRTADTNLSFEPAHAAFESSAKTTNAINDLQSLQEIINDSRIHPNQAWYYIILIIIGLGCLYLPWIAQPRNPRSNEGIFLSKKIIPDNLDEDYPSFIINDK